MDAFEEAAAERQLPASPALTRHTGNGPGLSCARAEPEHYAADKDATGDHSPSAVATRSWKYWTPRSCRPESGPEL